MSEGLQAHVNGAATASRPVRLTAAQAIVEFLKVQSSERDGVVRPLIGGVFGIFGHGNVCGLGQALEELGGAVLPYFQGKNEQNMVHAAIGFAKAHNRLSTLACTASIGPGSTNMITGAATATINRVPVLLFPSDTFAGRRQGPVLQQLEHPIEADLTVGDCFRPVSVFFDRISRPEQLLTALPQAMRALLDPGATGAVVVSLHQDVQGEAFDFPASFFEPRTWSVVRQPPAAQELSAAVALLANARRPLVIAGGGVRYSAAGEELGQLVTRYRIPVAETFAGKSTAPAGELHLGGLGVTGTQAAYEAAWDADVVLVVGSRLADFATGSHSIFQNPDVRFIAVNTCARDAYKLGATPVVADARVAIEALAEALAGRDIGWGEDYLREIRASRRSWLEALEQDLQRHPEEAMSQGEAIRVLNRAARPGDAVIAAAGSPPSDILRVWDAAEGSECFLEFGYSCMGHEIPAGVGFRLARREDPRGVFVMIGDGTYLMANTELVTAVQEQLDLTVLVMVNHGYQCIRALQQGTVAVEFGNEFRTRDPATGRLEGDWVEVDYAANARSLGCSVFEADDPQALRDALDRARAQNGPAVIVCRVDPYRTVLGSDCWWDLGVPEVSSNAAVVAAARQQRKGVGLQRYYG
jgi:3D-(3,5/4)-trihydroxycyclohexane-1,2-dione acylhydrolase (decyclizing)